MYIVNPALLRPYTIIEVVEKNGQFIDECYLVYGDNKLLLTPTEYALVQTLLNDGFDLEEASEERRAVNNKADLYITDDVAKHILFKLRKKISDHFPNLILPKSGQGSGNAFPPKIYTVEEIKKIHENLSNPGDGIVNVRDEFGRLHLFINGVEVRGRRGENYITRRALSLFNLIIAQTEKKNFDVKPVDFRQAWCEILGREQVSPDMLSAEIKHLRRRLERTGWTITSGRKESPYILIPYTPK
jgi:hypothetical protein